jgi:hypothetical protein
MIWIFERHHESLRIETRYDKDWAEFVLIMHQPNGAVETERFKGTEAFQGRLEVLETQLEADRWVQKGTTFLHDGWKL